ncbi:ATP-binding cassette domain-containing protein [Agromyces sp. SYSU K20354]|uniref:ABC transporter ATP-binding protein n=1 Tax=Agromyces cavernae TaxID=2898659 RepID=UPI001E390AA7|nr:ATP-binding cassette domain-containing protein [Agromyces cavernae]MCD2442929.1 ATP-binding cassette domain-containing protein [Agromyces cavernae]
MTSAAGGGLDARVVAGVGDFRLDVELAVAASEVLAVLGPNGSGKSTLLAAIAGHRALTAGIVRVGERVLSRAPSIGGDDEPGGVDDSGAADVDLAERSVGLLGQHPLLFPHLTALENVAFGPRAQGSARREARDAASAWLDRVGLAGLERRLPSALSGGQQQRVALARTLAARPDVLLLDEPFAALDVQTAAAMRRLVAEQRATLAIPTLLVTHDPLDAIVLADRAAILHDGRIVQQGPTAEVLGHPRTPFAAALAGVNLLTGVAVARDAVRVASASGPIVLRGTGETLRVGTPASVVFSPASVHARAAASADPSQAADSAPADNAWLGAVASLEPSRGGVRIVTDQHPDLAIDVPSTTAVALDLSTGATLAFHVAPADVSVRELS